MGSSEKKQQKEGEAGGTQDELRQKQGKIHSAGNAERKGDVRGGVWGKRKRPVLKTGWRLSRGKNAAKGHVELSA